MDCGSLPDVCWFDKDHREVTCLRSYEFTYKPVLQPCHAKGRDVELVVHDDPDGQNRKAMKAAKLPLEKDGKPIVHWRTKTKIPHNKFIIKFRGNTPAGGMDRIDEYHTLRFLGQSNVGHIISDTAVAKQYFDFWNIVKDDPAAKPAKAAVVGANALPAGIAGQGLSNVCFFSSRVSVDAQLVCRPHE